MTNYDLAKAYIKYNDDVLNNKIVTNKLIYLACKRMKSWFERDDMYFDFDDVDCKIRFMEKMKHSKGKFAGQYFRLLPYQQWITANIIGFKYSDSGNRVINTALLMLSRKAGKTFFAACLMIAIIMTDKERGAEGYMIANSASQASICFEHASNSCKSLDPKGKIFSRYRSEIRIPLLDSKIKVLSSETSRLDGYSPSIFIVDEYGEAKTNEVFNILRTGTGIRDNALGMIISTASFNVGIDFPLYAAWDNAKNVLEGNYEQDTLFAAIYQLDEGDDFKDDACWIKSNPTLGQTVSHKYLEEQVLQAVNDPSSEVSIRTKNFNEFCQSERVWIPNDYIKAVSQKFDYDIFDPEEHYSLVGIDIAERSDLCVVTSLIEKDDKVYLKAHPFICETAYKNSPNKELYRQWVNNGQLELVPTDSIDIDFVIAKINYINERVPIALVAYDPYHAIQLKIACEKQGIPMRAVRQGLGSFGEPTSLFTHMVYTKELIIDDAQIIRWCISNVLIKTDENENRKPVKASRHQKIDIVIAFIQSIKLWMDIKGISDNSDLDAVLL